jgi:hypothetical protein
MSASAVRDNSEQSPHKPRTVSVSGRADRNDLGFSHCFDIAHGWLPENRVVLAIELAHILVSSFAALVASMRSREPQTKGSFLPKYQCTIFSIFMRALNLIRQSLSGRSIRRTPIRTIAVPEQFGAEFFELGLRQASPKEPNVTRMPTLGSERASA